MIRTMCIVGGDRYSEDGTSTDLCAVRSETTGVSSPVSFRSRRRRERYPPFFGRSVFTQLVNSGAPVNNTTPRARRMGLNVTGMMGVTNTGSRLKKSRIIIVTIQVT